MRRISSVHKIINTDVHCMIHPCCPVVLQNRFFGLTVLRMTAGVGVILFLSVRKQSLTPDNGNHFSAGPGYHCRSCHSLYALRRFETLCVRFEMTKTPVGSGHETHVREKTGFSPYIFSQRHPPSSTHGDRFLTGN